MENVEMVQTVRNCRGIEIKKWCGSCKHKSQDKDEIRLCKLTGHPTLCQTICAHWELREALLSAGNGGAKVKSSEYLMYARAKRLEEEELIEQRVITSKQMMPCRELRRRFNKETGKGFYAIK